jgi:hypothetical protein
LLNERPPRAFLWQSQSLRFIVLKGAWSLLILLYHKGISIKPSRSFTVISIVNWKIKYLSLNSKQDREIECDADAYSGSWPRRSQNTLYNARKQCKLYPGKKIQEWTGKNHEWEGIGIGLNIWKSRFLETSTIEKGSPGLWVHVTHTGREMKPEWNRHSLRFREEWRARIWSTPVISRTTGRSFPCTQTAKQLSSNRYFFSPPHLRKPQVSSCAEGNESCNFWGDPMDNWEESDH